MDKHLTNVHTFHTIFGAPIASAPGFPDTSDAERDLLHDWAQALAGQAAVIKKQAKAAGEEGRYGMRDLLTRVQLHVEETAELVAAMADRDLVEALDALTDIDFVTNGTFLALGMASLKAPAHDAVHTSNMSKLGADGKPIVGADGRVVKGPNYIKPTETLRTLVYDAMKGG